MRLFFFHKINKKRKTYKLCDRKLEIRSLLMVGVPVAEVEAVVLVAAAPVVLGLGPPAEDGLAAMMIRRKKKNSNS